MNVCTLCSQTSVSFREKASFSHSSLEGKCVRHGFVVVQIFAGFNATDVALWRSNASQSFV